MNERRYEIVLFQTDNQQMTLDALALHARMHPAVVEQFIEFGLITPMKRERAKSFFDPSVVSRLQTIARLREGLGINLAGISVILDLVDRLSALQRENKALRSRL
jgi:DNA-binding transcriptional MerR regulator